MTHLMQSVRSFYDHLCSQIEASAERHEAEFLRLRAKLAKQDFKSGDGNCYRKPLDRLGLKLVSGSERNSPTYIMPITETALHQLGRVAF